MIFQVSLPPSSRMVYPDVQPAQMNRELPEEGRAEVLHLGRNNPMYEHSLGGSWLKSSLTGMDSIKEGVDKLITGLQCALVAKLAS